MRTIRNWMCTDNSIILFFDESGPESIDASDSRYKEIKPLLTSPSDWPKAAQILDKFLDKLAAAKGAVKVDGKVQIDGDVLPEELSSRLLMLLDSEFSVDPLVNFWRKLKQNPSPHAKIHLYRFLQSGHFPFTESGNFQAYKRVGNDFKDLYTHTMDNSVGKVVSMDRSKVDEDPNNTCSHGLHVAAWDYARHSYGSGSDNYNEDRFLVVEIDPKDVVSVPTDHSNQKMRVCKYTVVKECDAPTDKVVVADATPQTVATDTESLRLVALDSDNRLRIPNDALAALKPNSKSKFGVKVSNGDIIVTLANASEKYNAKLNPSKDVRISKTLQSQMGFDPSVDRKFAVKVEGKKVRLSPR